MPPARGAGVNMPSKRIVKALPDGMIIKSAMRLNAKDDGSGSKACNGVSGLALSRVVGGMEGVQRLACRRLPGRRLRRYSKPYPVPKNHLKKRAGNPMWTLPRRRCQRLVDAHATPLSTHCER